MKNRYSYVIWSVLAAFSILTFIFLAVKFMPGLGDGPGGLRGLLYIYDLTLLGIAVITFSGCAVFRPRPLKPDMLTLKFSVITTLVTLLPVFIFLNYVWENILYKGMRN